MVGAGPPSGGLIAGQAPVSQRLQALLGGVPFARVQLFQAGRADQKVGGRAQRVRTADPLFAFTDPPLRHSLPTVLAFAATNDRLTAVLTGPVTVAGTGPHRSLCPPATHDMNRVSIQGQPLTTIAALVWNNELPRALQQILVDTVYEVTAPALSSVG